MWELDYKKGRALKNWCFWAMVLEKTPESPLDYRINPKGNQPWIFIRKTDAEAPILWPSDGKSWFVRKDPDAGKDWGQNKKGATENEMVGWHHQLNGHEFDRKTWCAKVHGVAKSWMGLSDWTTNSKTIPWILHYTTYLLGKDSCWASQVAPSGKETKTKKAHLPMQET